MRQITSEMVGRSSATNLSSKGKFIKNIYQHILVVSFINILKSRLVPRTIPAIRRFDQEDDKKTDQEAKLGVSNSGLLGNILLFTILLCNFMETFNHTLSFSFNDYFLTTTRLALTLLFMAFNIVSIFLHSIIYRQVEGCLYTNPYKISDNYAKTNLIWDLLAIGMGLVSCFWVWTSLLLVVLRVWRMYEAVQEFELGFIDSEYKQNLWRLIFPIFFNIYICNLIAAILINMANYRQINWMTKFSIQDQDYLSQFMWALYWSITTLLTVGYGDITPANSFEAMVVSLIQLIGTILFIYNINSINNSLNNLTAEKTKLDRKLRVMRGYLDRQDNKITKETRNSILSSLKTSNHMNQVNEFQQQEKLLETLQRKQRSKLMLIILNKTIENIFFFNQFSEQTRKDFCLRLTRKVFHNGEYLSERNRRNNDFYVVQRGTVYKIFQKEGIANQSILDQYRLKNSNVKVFGLRTLLGNGFQLFSHRVADVCQLYQLKISKLKEILKKNRNDKEKFCQASDEALQGKFYNLETCDLCHIKHNRYCPKYHYVPYRQITALRATRRTHKGEQKQTNHKRHKTLFNIKTQSLRDQEAEAERENSIISSGFCRFDSMKLINIQKDLGQLSFQTINLYSIYQLPYNFPKQMLEFNRHAKKTIGIMQLVIRRFPRSRK